MRRCAQMTILRLTLGVMLLAGSIAPRPVAAATATATIAVTATVLSFCVVSALPLAFGNYASAQTDATTTITATCTNTTPYTISLDAGAGTGATTSVRKLTGAVTGDHLNYAIYSDTNRTTLWGNTIGTNTVAGTGTGLPQNITAYGRIPAGQSPGPGLYTDTVNVTLTY